MPVPAPEAFAGLYERLAPSAADLVDDRVRTEVLEAFKDVKAAAHPDAIAEIAGSDYVGRGLMAHALFLAWDDRREASFLLEGARDHMMKQLREEHTPTPQVYRLLEALTRLCGAWRAAGYGESA
jgi:hypothetical protein